MRGSARRNNDAAGPIAGDRVGSSGALRIRAAPARRGRNPSETAATIPAPPCGGAGDDRQPRRSRGRGRRRIRKPAAISAALGAYLASLASRGGRLIARAGPLRVAGLAFVAAAATDVLRFIASLPPGGGGIRGGMRSLVSVAGGGPPGSPPAPPRPPAPAPSTLFDCRGRVLATLLLAPRPRPDARGPGDDAWDVTALGQTSVPLSRVSPLLVAAVIASEDARFFRHRGVDVWGVGRAVVSLGKWGGGSTITQQLCKIQASFLSASRTVSRKLVEAIAAVWLERAHGVTKHGILEAYVNNVYWGHGTWGVASAAAVYFGKRPDDLSLAEAALLAAILPAPEHLSPFAPDGPVPDLAGASTGDGGGGGGGGRAASRALRAQRRVLGRMQRCGLVTAKEVAAARREGLPASLSLHTGGKAARQANAPHASRGLAAAPAGPFRAPYFVAEVLYGLGDILRGAAASGSGKERLAKGGLHVVSPHAHAHGRTHGRTHDCTHDRVF